MITKVEQMVQLVVTLDNVPGALADTTETLAKAGVNVLGLSRGDKEAQDYTVHLVTDKTDAGIAALSAAGKSVTKENVIEVETVENEPGIIAAITRALANAAINIETIYFTSLGQVGTVVVYIGVSESDTEKAIEILNALKK
jgi:hypothetical protein